MKLLGIGALAMTVISLLLWFANWILITFFLSSYGMGSPVRYVGQTASFLSAMAEFIAIGLLSIGLMLAAGLSKPAGSPGE
jgi:hypothetical protein